MNQSNTNRKLIRLVGYDYAQAGLYFVTICVQGRKCLFGHTGFGDIILNDAGRMIAKWYYELENKFPDIKCHEMVVMPNHFHCIIQNVGADLRVCSDTNVQSQIVDTIVDAPMLGEMPLLGDVGEHKGSPTSCGSMVQNDVNQRIHSWCKTIGLAFI